MGDVYAAYDPWMRRRVAIKLLRLRDGDSEAQRARFVREAAATAALEHEAVLPVYDCGEHETRPYLVMRFLGGGSLADRLSQGPMSLRECARVIHRVAGALDAAHASGIIHCDVSPGNILFDEVGVAYLADFGVMKIASELHPSGSRQLIGTPRYMSPEQAQNFPLDRRSDVYSLGIVAFCMLAGHPPFEGSSPMELAFAHAMTAPPPLTRSRPDLPSIADQVLFKALAKRANDRYPSASAFASDIEVVAEGRWYLLQLSDSLREVVNDAPFTGDGFRVAPGATPPDFTTELGDEDTAVINGSSSKSPRKRQRVITAVIEPRM